MAKRTRSRCDILHYTLEDWVYIILNNYNPVTIPADAKERVEYAFMQMAGKDKHVRMFKMHFGEKRTYHEIAQHHKISSGMAYRYVHRIEEMIRTDEDTRYILTHPLLESQAYLSDKRSLFRNDIWTYEVVELLKNDQTPFREICSDARYKYRRLESFFGTGFTVSDVVRASKEDFQKIKGYGAKTRMMVTVTIWQYYNRKIKEGMAVFNESSADQ